MFFPTKQWTFNDTETYIIGNSQTLKMYDAITFDTSAASNGSSQFIIGASGTTGNIYGVLVALTTGPGGSVAQDALVGFSPFSSYATASNNQTVGLVRGRVIPVKKINFFIADLQQNANTTVGSGNPGYLNMHASVNGQLDETSYVIPSGTQKQFFSVGSGVAGNTHGQVGIFPVAANQVIGYFSKTF